MLCSSPSQNWGCFFQFYSWIFLSSISWLIWPHTLCVGGGMISTYTHNRYDEIFFKTMKYFQMTWTLSVTGAWATMTIWASWAAAAMQATAGWPSPPGDTSPWQTNNRSDSSYAAQYVCFYRCFFCHSIFPTMILLFWEDVSAAALISLVPIMPHFLGGAPNMLWTTPRYEA